MSSWFNSTGTSLNRFRVLVFLLLLGWGTEAIAEVCVWRNPEKTMTQLFPEAVDYKTIDKKIPSERLKSIERRLGRSLDPGEREHWAYYDLFGPKGKRLGFVIADAEKGEYGVIEVVMGLTLDEKVNGIYIQKNRERKNRELKSRDFLSQFTGKDVKTPLEIGKGLKGIEGAEVAAQAIAFGVRKMLVFFDELGK